MGLDFIKIHYDNPDNCVSWQGVGLANCEACDQFFLEKVANRLNDSEGKNEFESQLRGLALTGMGNQNLEEMLKAGEVEPLDWAVGEALAETYLSEQYNVIFPWNMERDKRNIFASLPGADIVGFIESGNSHLLVFGEVKTSSENKAPPGVMTGRSGLHHQIDQLAHDLTKSYQLIKWLQPRVKHVPAYLQAFNNSCIAYLNSGKKSLVLFGILIRDTLPNEKDLSIRGESLRKTLSLPTKCNLLALHLPFDVQELIQKVKNGGTS